MMIILSHLDHSTIKERESPVLGRRMERIPENKMSLYSNYTQELLVAQLITL